MQLKDKHIWIADMGASARTTPHKKGLTNIRKPTEADSITVGNGVTESAGIIGDLRGVMCDTHGNELMEATMTDVTVLPNGGFNLFSVTKLQKAGWLLRGDDKSIELTKGERKIRFDIVIPTAKGM